MLRIFWKLQKLTSRFFGFHLNGTMLGACVRDIGPGVVNIGGTGVVNWGPQHHQRFTVGRQHDLISYISGVLQCQKYMILNQVASQHSQIMLERTVDD